jgi:hypothetical protein
MLFCKTLSLLLYPTISPQGPASIIKFPPLRAKPVYSFLTADFNFNIALSSVLFGTPSFIAVNAFIVCSNYDLVKKEEENLNVSIIAKPP